MKMRKLKKQIKIIKKNKKKNKKIKITNKKKKTDYGVLRIE